MIKSNSKKACDAIRAFIRENYTPENYGYEETDDLSVIAHSILFCFLNEKVVYDRRRMTYVDLFLEWLSGLPSIFHAGYILGGSAVDILGDMLDETEEERNRFTEDQAEKKLGELIYRELVKICPIWNV